MNFFYLSLDIPMVPLFKDIKDIKDIYIKGLKFYYVDRMEDVLDIVLLKS